MHERVKAAQEYLSHLQFQHQTMEDALAQFQEASTGLRSAQGLFAYEGWTERVIESLKQKGEDAHLVKLEGIRAILGCDNCPLDYEEIREAIADLWAKLEATNEKAEDSKRARDIAHTLVNQTNFKLHKAEQENVKLRAELEARDDETQMKEIVRLREIADSAVRELLKQKYYAELRDTVQAALDDAEQLNNIRTVNKERINQRIQSLGMRMKERQDQLEVAKDRAHDRLTALQQIANLLDLPDRTTDPGYHGAIIARICALKADCEKLAALRKALA